MNAASALGCNAVSRIIRQDIPHYLRCRRKEVGPIFPVIVLAGRYFQVRFVYQSGGLQRVALTLAPQISGRDRTQFPINQVDEARFRIFIASSNTNEQLCDVLIHRFTPAPVPLALA